MPMLNLTVNGQKQSIQCDPSKRLIDLLRDDLQLFGVKEGCGVGECGACTVLMDGKAVNACLIMAGQAQDAEILTIEGVQNQDGTLHPVQEAFIQAGAVQCGYCTPGMVLSSLALLNQNPSPGLAEIKAAVSGNMCRCTGYKQIIEAVRIAAEKHESQEEEQT